MFYAKKKRFPELHKVTANRAGASDDMLEAMHFMMGAILKESIWKKRCIKEKFSDLVTSSDEALLVFILEHFEARLKFECRKTVRKMKPRNKPKHATEQPDISRLMSKRVRNWVRLVGTDQSSMPTDPKGSIHEKGTMEQASAVSMVGQWRVQNAGTR